MRRKYNFASVIIVVVLLVSGCVKRPPERPVLPISRAPVEELRFQLDQALRNPAFENAFWGIAVQSLVNGQILFEQNARKLMMPASNMKLITAAAALKQLGSGFRYDTQIHTDGKIENGVLKGNLLIIGSGDPTISARFGQGDAFQTFQIWSKKIKELGISIITGDVIGIDEAFDDERIGYGWSWDDLPYYYATETGALQFAENAITVTLVAGHPNELVTIQKEPSTCYINVVQDVRAVSEGTEPRVSWSYNPESRTVYATGTLPSNGQDYGSFSVHNPGHYFVTALKETLIRNGIAVEGDAYRARDHSYSLPIDTEALFTHQSPPLSEIVSVVLKASQNLFAETLLKTLGNGKFSTGVEQVRNTLSGMQISPNNFIITDGSGLSRYNYVTPNGLIQLLQKMYTDPQFDTFFNALAIAGVDGTLRSRMKGTSAENNVRAKTGSLSNVRSISGYARTRDAEMLAFVVIANNYSASNESVQQVQDAIVQHLTNFSRK